MKIFKTYKYSHKFCFQRSEIKSLLKATNRVIQEWQTRFVFKFCSEESHEILSTPSLLRRVGEFNTSLIGRLKVRGKKIDYNLIATPPPPPPQKKKKETEPKPRLVSYGTSNNPWPCTFFGFACEPWSIAFQYLLCSVHGQGKRTKQIIMKNSI